MVTLAQEDSVAHQLGAFDADAHLLRNPFENHAVARRTAVGTGVVDLEHQRQFAADAHRVAEHGRIGRRPLEPAGLLLGAERDQLVRAEQRTDCLVAQQDGFRCVACAAHTGQHALLHRIEHESRGRRGRHLPHQIAREHLQVFLNPVAQRVRLGRGLRLLSKVEFLRAHADEED